MSTTTVWQALLAMQRLNSGGRLARPIALGCDESGSLCAVEPDAPEALFCRDASGRWRAAPQLGSECAAVADLYLPVCTSLVSRPFVIGHLGQSLDGYVATQSGDSYYVTGPENILHLHRLRALCDAVIVGAGTIAADDPELTARRASGGNPVRVVLDPKRRLTPQHKVFSDGRAPTRLVCGERVGLPQRHGDAEILAVPMHDERLDLNMLLERLFDAGLRTIFVEGGGRTVSAFLEASLLDRLQITVACLLVGRGRPGLRTSPRESMAECLRPRGSVYRMGRDVLFDCDLRAEGSSRGPEAGPGFALERIR